MLTKIKKTQNLGIFKDYSHEPDTGDFKKFNLIYGWNGSGKTTLSELFTAFSGSVLSDFPELKYQIQYENKVYDEKGEPIKQIRVFNQRYVVENINLIDSSAKSILILGKDQKSLLDFVVQDEKILNGDSAKEGDVGKIKALWLKNEELKNKEKEKNQLFTSVAKIISENISGVSARNYTKRNAEQAFSLLTDKKILLEDSKSEYSTTLRQQPKEKLSSVSSPLGEVDSILVKAKSLLGETVVSMLIERLKNNPDISKWVEMGVALHESASNCEFCNQVLPEKRLEDLSKYFNDEDKQLKVALDELLCLVDDLVKEVEDLVIPEKANLYDELQTNYEKVRKEVIACKETFLDELNNLKNEITSKKQKTTEVMNLTISLSKDSFDSFLDKLNNIITQCNKKTNDFQEAKETATKALENHYLSEEYDKVADLKGSIATLTQNIKDINNGNPSDPNDLGIVALQKRIQDNKNKMSRSGTACSAINDKLRTFLGRGDITFETADEGYLIKRNGQLAKNLSEGEKTAIAFVYFTIDLEDRDFNLQKGIVVIDDPISSLDSNSIFQAFAFLKNAVKDAQQIFILTHNFNFLKLLLLWFKRMNDKSVGYFMLKNKRDADNNRVAIIEKLDELLKGYDTEYQYLFKLLFDFASSNACTIEEVYHFPNISRKVLEYFLRIAIPNKESDYNKLQSFDQFDENKRTAIWKFTNDQSHITGDGFDPALVVECKNNVNYLLEMIKAILPQHYEALTAVAYNK